MKFQLMKKQIQIGTMLKQGAEKKIEQFKKNQDRELFYANTNKHYKIWFSKDRDIFLPSFNIKRLINMKKNVKPDTEISFVYSGNLLSEKAKEDMQKFCTCHGIIPINFDTIETTKGHDEKIKELIKLELEKAIKNEGGDLAAASDLARIMIALAETCGIYSDFDFIFTDKMKTIGNKVKIDTPIALHYEFTLDYGEYSSNHIIVPTTTGGGGKRLTEKCIKCFEAAQEASIKLLTQDLTLSLLYETSGDRREFFATNLATTLLPLMLQEFLKRNKEDQSIYNFRSFVKKIDYKTLLSVLSQVDKTKYENIEDLSEQEAFNMFVEWIIMPGNIERIDEGKSILKIMHTGLFYMLKNGCKLGNNIKLKMVDGEPIDVDILDQETLEKKIIEHKFDVANIFMRAIKDSLYLPTVTCITGPELQCNVLTQQYIKPKETQTINKFIENISLKIFHGFDKIFKHEHFKIGDMQDYFQQRINSTKSFSEAIANAFQLNPCKTDVYWSEEGKRNMDTYVAEENAATKIQKYYRKKHPKSWSDSVSGQKSIGISQ